MTYDFHGAWDLSATYHQSALYPNPQDPSEPEIAQYYNVDSAVQQFLDAGVAPEQLVVGVPFYGRAWKGVPDTNNGLFQPSTGVPPGTWDDWSSGPTGVNDFTEIVSFLKTGQYTMYRDAYSKVPWLYSPSEHDGHFISFDDSISIAIKTQFVQDNALGGVMFWEITGDREEQLVDVIVKGLGGQSE